MSDSYTTEDTKTRLSVYAANDAETGLAELIVTLQPLRSFSWLELSQALQELNRCPLLSPLAVKVTTVPDAKLAEHVVGQLMPLGDEVTEPQPVWLIDTLRV